MSRLQNIRIQPETPKEARLAPRIAVIGVGGAGGNAVKNMIETNLQGVEFIVCNSDAQALEHNPAPVRVQLGRQVTKGLGAGSRPDVGRASAEESIDEVLAHLENVNMVFITAGMGGGTGTGAAPIIAEAARAKGVLTVGVVTKPFHFEGAHRMRAAEEGIKNMEHVVDTLIIIPNQNLFRIANEKTTFNEAFRMADGVLQSGVRGVTDLMVLPGLINLDFNDIRNVMGEMGKAMMGTGEAAGDGRALRAAEAAVNNPLLDDVSMKGARGVIINITGGYDMSLYEVDEACNYIRDQVDANANIIFGSTFDPSLEGGMRISVVATGIDQEQLRAQQTTKSPLNAPAAARSHSYMPAAAEVGPSPVPFHYAPPKAASVTLETPLQQPSMAAPIAPPAYTPPTLSQAEPAPIPQLPLTGFAAWQEEQHHNTAQDHNPAPAATLRPAAPARMPDIQDMHTETPPRKGQSLFERLKNSILPEVHSTAHYAPQGASQAASAPTASRRPSMTSTAAQPQASLDIAALPQQAHSAQQLTMDDDLEIPAFLRRQAN